MKKLFYIVLVVIILLVIGKFVMNETPTATITEEVTVDENVAPEEAPAAVDAEAIGNMEVSAENAEANDGQVVEEEAAVEEVEEG